MCEKHKKLTELWVSPEDSQFISSKQVILHKGQSMPTHTTGPDKEEVIVCCAGSVKVKAGRKVAHLFTGNACFIPRNTKHSVHFNNAGNDHAIYVYVVNKAQTEQRGAK